MTIIVARRNIMKSFERHVAKMLAESSESNKVTGQTGITSRDNKSIDMGTEELTVIVSHLVVYRNSIRLGGHAHGIRCGSRGGP